MVKYKFQFKTGNICDGPIEMKVNDFVGEIPDDQVNASLVSVIEARGGVCVEDEPVKPKRKPEPVKWTGQDGKK